MHKRRLKLLGKVMLLSLALIFGFLLIERIRGQIGVAAFRRELAAKGEKLTPQELSKPTSGAEHGAQLFTQAYNQLQQGLTLPDSPPPKMRVLPSGRAIIGYREAAWVQEQATNDWDEVKSDLQTNAQTLTRICEILEQPVFNHNLDYAQGVDLLIPHLASARPLTAWLGAASQLSIRESNRDGLRQNLVAQARIPRIMEEDRLLISELVRVAAAMLARSAVWETLQSDALTEDDWAVIQQAWEARSFAKNMVRSLEGDRIYCDYSYDLLRKSNEKTAQAFYGLEEWIPVEDQDRPWWERNLRALPYGRKIADFIKVQIYCRIWRFAWSHQAQVINMKCLQGLTEIARLGVKQKSFAELRTNVEELEAKMESQSFYFRLRYPFRNPYITLSASVKKAMQAETERSIALCAIALKRHLLRHGHYPESLTALAPELLESVPVDYMDGKPIKYRLNPDGSFTLYSVGEDGVDDGGDASLQPDRTGMRNLWHRKDFVWPAPATPEEVGEYRREASKDSDAKNE